MGASPPAKQEPKTATADKQSPSNASLPVSDEYKPYPDKYAEACYKASNHDSADLCAQWRAAIAAEKAADATTWANWISTAGTLLSFVSVILVLVALGQTRKANRLTMRANARATRQAIQSAAETAKALDIAERNAKTVEDTAYRQLRAYVVVRYAHYIIQGADRPVKLHVMLENTGKTPAKNIRAVCTGVICETNAENFGELPSIDIYGGVDVGSGAGHELNNNELILGGARLAEIEAGTQSIYVYGYAVYEDIFHNSHKTTFLLESSLPTTNGRFKACKNGNTST